MPALVIQVRLHDGRYHGRGDWPPSPARLFQALVAGVGISGPLGTREKDALAWLERRPAPILAAPRARHARSGVFFYMPNNDSDRIEGDPAKMAKIRTATKVFRPYLFDAQIPFVYSWPLGPETEDQQKAAVICSLAERLYQLGRGIDMAWAWGETLDEASAEHFLASYPGQVFRPSTTGGGIAFPAPCNGSLDSVERRYRAYGARFSHTKDRTSTRIVFRQPPKVRFQSVSYESPASRQVYTLRDPITADAFVVWPLARAHELATRVRDAAVDRLKRAMPARAADIDRALVGRKPDGTNDSLPENRVRVIPLPSIGHIHADREIRRLLVEAPSSCALGPDDIQWAFSGLDIVTPDTGETLATLIRAEDGSFLRHYGVEDVSRHRVWRSVTPVAVPGNALRYPADLAHRKQQLKSGLERQQTQMRAAAAFSQALRHAGLRGEVRTIRVQREPFEGNGPSVEDYAEGTRFDKQRLWHVEVEFDAPLNGPLAIGDGRFVGLGVFAPLVKPTGIYVFSVQPGLNGAHNPETLARALRRAVMARVQEFHAGALPAFFSGHEADGSPARAPKYSHLAFSLDPDRGRLLIIAPHVLDRRTATNEELEYLAKLDAALDGFTELRAGQSGVLSLLPIIADVENDELFAPSRVWNSKTQYRVTRHFHASDARAALTRDIKAQLRSRGFPEANVTLSEYQGIAGRGLECMATLEFNVAVTGPLILGRTRYLGGGLFSCKKT